MARMRTIQKAVQHIKTQDPESALSEWYLRQLLRSGKLKHHKAGNKYLVDIDYLDEFLKNPVYEYEDKEQYGKLRKIY